MEKDMPQHDIEIQISKTGEVTVAIKGVKGKGCLKYAEFLKSIIGEVKSQQLTSEYYEPDEQAKIDLRVQQKQGG